MHLEKIITLANANTRLRFLAMERSLRATGCNLPLWVIPYDEKKFELPKGSTWWELTEMTEWLQSHQMHPTMRKYQCLLESNYQFVDSDVIFLKNPQTVLQSFKGFIICCTHWNNTGHVTTPELMNFFEAVTTTWQQKIFNTGQFACDRALYDFEELKRTSENRKYRGTCIDFRFHEQPGVNLLVNVSGIAITNITLQPYYVESSWAGDYKDEDYTRFWKEEERKPYLIHWAGCEMHINRPIDQLFLNFLTVKEKGEWKQKVKTMEAEQNKLKHKMSEQLRKIKTAVKTISH